MRQTTRRFRKLLVYALLRGLLLAAWLAPLRVLRAIGSGIGALGFRLRRGLRRRAYRHLCRAFPDRPRAWRRRVLAASFRHLGQLLGEAAWLWSATPGRLLRRTRFEGLEHLTEPLGRHRGVVLVTGHCGNWEWLNLALGAAGVPMTVAVRGVDDPRLRELVSRLRARFGTEEVERGAQAGRKLLQAMSSGRVGGLLIDQDIDVPGAFVPFFGRPAWTPTGAAALAMKLGIPLTPGFAARMPDGTMRLSFDPPIPPPEGPATEAAVAELTARLTLRIEEQVRAHPEQWVWIHKRWARRPGEFDPASLPV